MKEKIKSTPKAKLLTAVLLVLFLGSCAVLVFAVCTDILGINSNTPPTETVVPTETTAIVSTTASVPETTPSSSVLPTTTSEAVETVVSLGSIYDVDYWTEYKDEYGSAGIGVLFGAHAKGATITFENGRFVVSVVGANETLDVSSGTYSFVSDNEIELRYDNSDIRTAKVIETENDVVTVLDFSMDMEDTTLRASLAD